jgi:hypothetical protein
MTFKPAIWYPIAVVLSAINLVSVLLTAGSAEPWHPAAHAALAVAFGLWAQRLRERRGGGGSERRAQPEALAVEESRLEALEADVNRLRQELSEAQERLDFTERLLAQGPDSRKLR